MGSNFLCSDLSCGLRNLSVCLKVKGGRNGLLHRVRRFMGELVEPRTAWMSNPSVTYPTAVCTSFLSVSPEGANVAPLAKDEHLPARLINCMEASSYEVSEEAIHQRIFAGNVLLDEVSPSNHQDFDART